MLWGYTPHSPLFLSYNFSTYTLYSVYFIFRSEESVQSKSQLSYRKMTPKASPLPPSLQMTRGEKQVRTDDSPSSQKSGQASPKSHRSSEHSTKSPTPRSEYSARSQGSHKSQRSVASRKSDRSRKSVPEASEEGSHKTTSPRDTPRDSAPGTPQSSQSHSSRRSTRSRGSYKSADKTIESGPEDTTGTEEQTTVRSTEGESVAEASPRQEQEKHVERPSSHSSAKHSTEKAGETTPTSARSNASKQSKRSVTAKDD